MHRYKKTNNLKQNRAKNTNVMQMNSKSILNKIKRSKSIHKQQEDRCDKLWSHAVKLRAGFKSELSGKTEYLNSHHILGKASYRLRYELDNGICLTSGEHKFIAHHAGRAESFRRKVQELRGWDIYETLYLLKWDQCKTDLNMVEIYLKEAIKKIEAGVGTFS